MAQQLHHVCYVCCQPRLSCIGAKLNRSLVVSAGPAGACCGRSLPRCCPVCAVRAAAGCQQHHTRAGGWPAQCAGVWGRPACLRCAGHPDWCRRQCRCGYPRAPAGCVGAFWRYREKEPSWLRTRTSSQFCRKGPCRQGHKSNQWAWLVARQTLQEKMSCVLPVGAVQMPSHGCALVRSRRRPAFPC